MFVSSEAVPPLPSLSSEGIKGLKDYCQAKRKEIPSSLDGLAGTKLMVGWGKRGGEGGRRKHAVVQAGSIEWVRWLALLCCA